MILVTGASGTVGKEILQLLADQKHPVRAMTRDPTKIKPDVFPNGVEIVAGDFERPETLAPALAGVTKVFALSAGPELGKHAAALARAAKTAGAKHIVKLSAETVEDHPNQLIGRWHAEGERAIAASGLVWTFVRPGGLLIGDSIRGPSLFARDQAATLTFFGPPGDAAGQQGAHFRAVD